MDASEAWGTEITQIFFLTLGTKIGEKIFLLKKLSVFKVKKKVWDFTGLSHSNQNNVDDRNSPVGSLWYLKKSEPIDFENFVYLGQNIFFCKSDFQGFFSIMGDPKF